MYYILILSQLPIVFTTTYSVDISQATYQFHIILNKFCKFYGIPYYKIIIYTALHLVMSFVGIA